jgi:two-component system sensor histidine kinase MtrB
MVFDRFWRADPARARTTGGTGLGLAISLEDARLHNGWLQAWGEPGRGSVFRLTVPRVGGQELVGSPLPLGPDEADPGPELIHAPLTLRVSPGRPGQELAGTGLPGTGFSAGYAGIQPAGSRRAGTDPEGRGSAGAGSG